MSATRWILADVIVGRSGHEVVNDPVADLLCLVPTTSKDVDIGIDVEGVVGPAPDPGGVPRCFHGEAKVRALGDEGALVVHDGSTRVDVARQRLRVTTPVDPAARSAGVADVTLLLGLILALRHHGRFHLHGGLLARGDEGVLVVGTSGAGKTTTCLALESGGHTLHGDDVTFVGNGGRAWALPRALHVGRQTAQAFPHVAPRLGPTLPSGKRPLPPASHAVHAVDGALVRRLVLPVIAAQATTTTSTPTQAEVFGALIEAGAFVVVDGLPGVETQLALLGQLATLPATLLTIGRDALDDGGVITRALAEAP